MKATKKTHKFSVQCLLMETMATTISQLMKSFQRRNSALKVFEDFLS